jgi:hypothetical protein
MTKGLSECLGDEDDLSEKAEEEEEDGEEEKSGLID